MYGPNQVGDIIIGSGVATQTTAQTFIASALDKEVGIFQDNGAAIAANKSFKFLQKTSGDAVKGLNYEFSDVINPKYLNRITVSNFAAEIQKQVTVAGFTGNVLANTTYEVEVKVYNDGGTLSPENFATVQGFYVTGSSVSAETATTIRDGVLKSLTSNFKRRGDFEVVLAAVAGPGITVTGKLQKAVPGKIEGRQIEFDVIAKVYQNVQDLTQPQQNLGLLTTTVNATNFPGAGTGKQAVNYEWFVKGGKYEVYRTTGYPADFATPYYADASKTYNVIDLVYYAPRLETSVERQYKTLRILADTTGLTGKTELVTKLATITGLTIANPGTTICAG
jgi:hypothetical protein